MGLFDRLRGIKDPVDAEYRLVACSMNSGGAVYENCTMDGVVTGPGIPATSVHHVALTAPTAKWPTPGQTLPVTVDRNDPSRLKIRWDAVPSNAQRAQALAAQQAAAMRSGTTTGGASGAPADLPVDASAMVADIVARAKAAGATVTTSVEQTVVGADGRPLPGSSGGGLTPEESASAQQGGAAALGLRAMDARVLAAHEVAVPAGLPQAPGGTWDLTLDLAPADGGSGWTSVLRISFSSIARREQIAAIGRSLPVFADPVRHDRIAVDTTRLS